MTESATSIEYTLTSTPIEGLFREVTMLVGLEDEPDGALRVYLGARYKGVYMLIPAGDPAQQEFRRAWARSAMGHTWMYPIPPREALHLETESA